MKNVVCSVLNLSKLDLCMFMIRRDYSFGLSEGLGHSIVLVTFGGKIRSYLNLEELSKGLNMGLEDLRLKLKGGELFYSVTMSDYVRLMSVSPLIGYEYSGPKEDVKESFVCKVRETLGLRDFSEKDFRDYFLLNDDYFMTVNYLMDEFGKDGLKISKKLFALRLALLHLIVSERPNYLIIDLSTGKEYVRKSLLYTAIEHSVMFGELLELLNQLEPIGNGAYFRDGKTGKLYELKLTDIRD
jgi:hypothetical protein